MNLKRMMAAGVAMLLASGMLLPAVPASDVTAEGLNVVTTGDLRKMENCLLGNAPLEKEDSARFDLNSDGVNDAYDLVIMRRDFISSGMQVGCETRIDRMYIEYNVDMINKDDPQHIAVITCTADLDEYMTEHYSDTTAAAFLTTYDDSYFAENVLLLASLYQPDGLDFKANVYSVNCMKNTLNVMLSRDYISGSSAPMESALLIQVTVPVVEYVDMPFELRVHDEGLPDQGDEQPTTEPSGQPTTEPQIVEPTQPPVTRKQLRVVNIKQNPELPTGCEVTSLTILLNHLGFSVNKVVMARKYLPKQEFYYEDGIYYGADFRTTFAGDPESEYSYGCYAPCIVTTANSYFKDQGVTSRAYNTTGTTLDDLLTNYIDKDVPVLIWITSSNLHESTLTSMWMTPAGEVVQWRAYEHCVVLTGYDKEKNIIFVSDPLIGNAGYNRDLLETRFKEMGSQSVYIMK